MCQSCIVVKDTKGNPKPIPESIIANYMKQVLSALIFCHGKGVIHRGCCVLKAGSDTNLLQKTLKARIFCWKSILRFGLLTLDPANFMKAPVGASGAIVLSGKYLF